MFCLRKIFACIKDFMSRKIWFEYWWGKLPFSLKLHSMLGSLLSACFCRICQLPTLVSWGEQLSEKHQLRAESLQPGASQSASASPLSLQRLLECYLASSKTKRGEKRSKVQRRKVLWVVSTKGDSSGFLDCNSFAPHPWVPSRSLRSQPSVRPRPAQGEEACSPPSAWRWYMI